MGYMEMHCGGWIANLEDLASVPVPVAAGSEAPIPYPSLVDEVKRQLPRHGLSLSRERYALARGGAQMFGVLSTLGGALAQDYTLFVGLRSSYDRSLGVGLTAGSQVFICDNLAFHGEAGVEVEHRSTVLRDLPRLTSELLESVSAMRQRIAEDIQAMKEARLSDQEVPGLVLAAMAAGAITPLELNQVMQAWGRPDHEAFLPRTAWSLFNAATGVLGARGPQDQIDGTLRLTQVFREALVPVG